MAGEQGAEGIRIDDAVDQGGLQATPTAPVHRLQAEVYRGEHRAVRQQGIGEFEQRIAAGAKAAGDGSAERPEGGKPISRYNHSGARLP